MNLLEEIYNLDKLFYYFFFYEWWDCQDEDSSTTLRKLAWLKRSAWPWCRIDQLTVTKNCGGTWFASKVFPVEKKQNLPLQFSSGDGRFSSRRYNQSSVGEATSQCAVLYANNQSIQFSENLLSVLPQKLMKKQL